MAKILVGVLLDLEYPDSDVGESSFTTSMSDEVVRIVEAGAVENSFDVTHVLSGVRGAESMFELVAQ